MKLRRYEEIIGNKHERKNNLEGSNFQQAKTIHIPSFFCSSDGFPEATNRGLDINMDKLLKTFFLLLFIMGLALPLTYADDLDPHYKFSGVKAPDSPYKNTWGAFQTDLFSGSFSYEYKIDVPPGTNGLEPDISIRYNSHSAKGKAGWVGAG